MPVTLQGPKGGYLYVKIIEAGNLDALEPMGVCCDPLSSGGCPGAPCGSRPPAQLRVQISCASLERAVSASSQASLDAKTNKAVFDQELLMKSLNFCSVDVLTVKLMAKSTTLGEANMPLRVALPTPLANGLPDHQVDHSQSQIEESGTFVVEPEKWLPVQRIFLRRQSSGTILKGATVPPSTTKSEPYLDLQLLQLVDGSLPQLRGTTPLMLAIEQRQEQLVRAYLSLDVAETLPFVEQAACVTAAIQLNYHEVLVLLLDRIKPLHQHLLLAIRLHAVDLVEALLQAGGAPLLHPRPRMTRESNRRGGMARQRPEPTTPQYSSGLRDLDEASPTRRRASSGLEADSTLSGRPGPQLTPLSVACQLGDVAIVEAICQWARREKVHVDPTAPVTLGPETPSVTLGGMQARANDTTNNGGVALWWDQDDSHRGGDNQGDVVRHGDPPMVMAVRGRGHSSSKLHLINTLARFGFSADIRSPVDSWTPLLAAVELGNSELVEALVNLGGRLSADRHLGFTPLHLACQMAQWHLVPVLTESMCGQYNRVAAWGPSPQYVSLNLVDAYGRTALDIALLRYFANPLPYSNDSGKSPTSGSERQKAVDILREFVHRSPPEDPGIVCGWELLRVLRFLDALPSKKAVGAQLWGADWTSPPEKTCDPKKLGAMAKVVEEKEPQQVSPYGDIEELLQAVRVLVRAGSQTKYLLQDLLQPPARGVGQVLESNAAGHDFKECITSLGPRVRSDSIGTACKYSLLDADDFSEVSVDEAPIRSV
jgi:ankyrin repeat protein